MQASTRYDRVIVGRGDPENSGDEDPEELDSTRVLFGYRHRFNRVAVGLTASLRRSDYVASEDRDQDRVEGRIASRVGYIASPNLTFFVEPYYSTRQYDRREDFSGLERDANQLGVFLGSEYDITGIITGETSIDTSSTTARPPRSAP